MQIFDKHCNFCLALSFSRICLQGSHISFFYLGEIAKMMIKTIIGISLICFAAALPWDGENPWTKLLDNQENDELDFIQNDRK